MNKNQLDYALKTSIYSAYCDDVFRPRIEAYGSTPLNAAVMAMKFSIEDFRKRHPVDKMRLITLTDGESNPTRYHSGSDLEHRDVSWRDPIMIEVNGKNISLGSSYADSLENTSKCIKALCGKDITSVNFFITDAKNFSRELYRLHPWDNDEQNKLRKEMKNNGTVLLNDDIGYDHRFLILNKSASLSTNTESLVVKSDATNAQITNAFKKYSGSKKNNRILTTKFADMIA